MRPLLRSSVSPPPHGESGAGEQAISVDSDMVVILASLLCALISVVGLALVARCACRWPRQGSNSIRSSSAPPAKGLKKAAIDALPTVCFAQQAQGGGGGSSSSECAICLAELAEGEELRVLPHCAHAFHVACIDTWLGAHASCPSCRATVMAAGRCRSCGAACDLDQGAAC